MSANGDKTKVCLDSKFEAPSVCIVALEKRDSILVSWEYSSDREPIGICRPDGAAGRTPGQLPVVQRIRRTDAIF